MCNFHLHNLHILLYKLFSSVYSLQQKRCQQIYFCWHPLILMDFVHIFIYWLTSNKFAAFLRFNFSLILCYFPQQFLYFFPEPHVPFNLVFMLFIVYIVFPYFTVPTTLVFIVFMLLMVLYIFYKMRTK